MVLRRTRQSARASLTALSCRSNLSQSHAKPAKNGVHGLSWEGNPASHNTGAQIYLTLSGNSCWNILVRSDNDRNMGMQTKLNVHACHHMHGVLQNLHLFFGLDRIAFTRLRPCNTDGERSCRNICLSFRENSLVRVELDNARLDCQTLEKIMQLLEGKVKFPEGYSSEHGILFYQVRTIDAERSRRRVTDGQILHFPAHQQYLLEVGIGSICSHLLKSYPKDTARLHCKNNVQGLACLAKDLARHRQACPIMKTKGFWGLGNRKIINLRRDIQQHEDLHHYSLPVSSLFYTLRHCPVSYYVGYTIASPGQLQLAHITKQRNVGPTSPAPRQQNSVMVSEVIITPGQGLRDTCKPTKNLHVHDITQRSNF